MTPSAYRSRFGETAWETLRLSVALVCRDSLPASESDNRRWVVLASTLKRVGTRASAVTYDRNLAGCVLADFEDEETCQRIVNRTKILVATLSEPALCKLTEKAGAMVDQKCPDQALSFRVTLVLVSMIAANAISNQAGQ